MRKISKIIVLSLVMSFAFSQTAGKLRGVVTSSDGQPLAGANVIVDGTTKGAATDGEGKYLKQHKANQQLKKDAKEMGYGSDTKGYVETKARYGSKENMKSGRGLGT